MTLNEKLREMLPNLGMPVASLKLANDVDGNIEYHDVYTAEQIMIAIQEFELKLKVQEGVWIELKEHGPHPQDGQKIRGKSDTGEWEEVWDSSEPLGHMTHWKSA